MNKKKKNTFIKNCNTEKKNTLYKQNKTRRLYIIKIKIIDFFKQLIL